MTKPHLMSTLELEEQANYVKTKIEHSISLTHQDVEKFLLELLEYNVHTARRLAAMEKRLNLLLPHTEGTTHVDRHQHEANRREDF
jgi:hypothetical protein